MSKSKSKSNSKSKSGSDPESKNIDKTQPSICIPRTINNVTRVQVKAKFEELMGKDSVNRVDIIHLDSDSPQKFCRIFVHFDYWNTKDQDIVEWRQALNDGDCLNIAYNFPAQPHFWKCVKSRIPKPENQVSNAKPKVSIVA